MATSRDRRMDDVESNDDDDVIESTESDADKIDVRLTTWNLEGAEDTPGPKDLMAVAFPAESRTVHIYALQEVKTLEKIRDALYTCIGGPQKFELFEHWMGRSGSGFPGCTVLLVFAPRDLCTTGKFRLSRFANSQVKREVLRGTRFKFLGGTTSSRGAIAMPFTFLDTTFSIVSMKLVEEETEKNPELQQRDLEKILELCKMTENAEVSTAGSLHHTFVCGSFARPPEKEGTSNSSSSRASISPPAPEKRRSISSRFSFVRRNTTKPSGGSTVFNDFAPLKKKFDVLSGYEEVDEADFTFEPDHIIYRSASEKLKKCLTPVSSAMINNVRCGRPPVTVLFKIQGSGSHILSSWSRLTGNLPMHLSSRSNYVHARNEPAQRPRMSTAPILRREHESRAATLDYLKGGNPFHEEKFVLMCTRCEAPISDSEPTVPVTKEGCAYHARCFCCDHCGVPLCDASTNLSPGQQPADILFHEVEGQLLCQKSFETLYVKVCEVCNGPLGDEFLSLPGHGSSADQEPKRFHVSCFKCGICNRPFATKVLMGDVVVEAAILHNGMYICEQDFANAVGGVKCCVCDHSFPKGIKANGDIYCQNDFNETFSGGVCVFCSKPMTEDLVLTLSDDTGSGQKRACHIQCLKCVVCQRKLHELNESFVEFESQTYCKADWEKRQAAQVAPQCAKCRLAVKGEHVDALDSVFHPSCFTCAFCNQSLVGTKFYNSEGKLWCLNDFERFCCSDLPACPSCHRTVGSSDKPRAQEFGNLTWHGECFVCGKCGVSLKGRKNIRTIKGKVYCEKC